MSSSRWMFLWALCAATPLLLSGEAPTCAVVFPDAVVKHDPTVNKRGAEEMQLSLIDGNVIVVRYTGDANAFTHLAGGLFDPAPRQALLESMYGHLADVYDFVVVASDFSYIDGALAFYVAVQNDTQGIGLDLFDQSSDYHSNGRLQGIIELGNLDKYRDDAVIDPDRFRGTVLHEIGHRWLAWVDYLKDNQVSNHLLQNPRGHWSFLLDSDGSYFYGHDWLHTGNSTYRAGEITTRYSDLDLYLMGFLAPAQVAPMTLLHSSAVADHSDRFPQANAQISATPETVSIDQVIAVEGTRVPAADGAIRSFRVAFVYLHQGAAPDQGLRDQINAALAGLDARFQSQTVGLGHLDLRPATLTSESEQADSQAALAFLDGRKQAHGLWEDRPETLVRDSTAAMQALAAHGRSITNEITLLRGLHDRNHDETARILTTLHAVGERDPARRDSLLAAQQANGGFALRAGYEANALDTALALQALAALNDTASNAAIGQVLAYLQAQRHNLAGWGRQAGDPYTTAVVLTALSAQTVDQGAAVQTMKQQATAWLLTRQSAQGAVGFSDADVAVTGAVLRSLADDNSSDARARQFLMRSQANDGSWNHHVRDTAAALLGLRAAETLQAADLVLSRDRVQLIPEPPIPGQALNVQLNLANNGAVAAENTRVQLYNGDPDQGGLLVAESALAEPLAAGADRDLSLIWTVPAETTSLFLVLRATTTSAEGNPADNRLLWTFSGDNNGPDAALNAASTFFSSLEPALGETLSIVTTVENQGNQDITAATLTLYDGDPDLGLILVGPTALPILPAGGAPVTAEMQWLVNGTLGARNLVLAVQAPDDLRATNDRVQRTITVTTAADGVDVGIEPFSLVLTPNTYQTMPQQTRFAFSLVNKGNQSPDPVTLEVWRGLPEAGGSVVAAQTVSFAGETRLDAALDVTMNRLGDHDWVVRAVPTGSDVRTADNRVVHSLNGLAYDDFEVVTDSLAISPGLTGTTNTLSVTIHNYHVQPRQAVRVRFEADLDGATQTLAETTTALPALGQTTVRATWPAPDQPQNGTLRVLVDPENQVTELDEDDNQLTIPLITLDDTLANLRISAADLSLSPGPYVEGEALTLNATVHNSGRVDVASAEINLYLDSTANPPLTAAIPINDLAAGTFQTVQFNLDPIPFRGSHALLVRVQTADNESNTDDNLAYLPIHVAGGPNAAFGPTPIALAPAWPAEGETVTATIALQNAGATAANNLAVVLRDGDETGAILAQTTLDLAPGHAEVALSFTIPNGLRRILCLLDPDDQISEQVETDNRAQLGFLPRQGDFGVDSAIFSPNDDGVQDQVTLFWDRVESPLTLILRDLRGQRLREWRDLPAAGARVWNGRDQNDAIVPDGFYRFELHDPNGGFVLRDLTVSVDTDQLPIRDALAETEPGFFNRLDESVVVDNWLGWTDDSSAVIATGLASGPEILPPNLVAPDGSGATSFGEPMENPTVFTLTGRPGSFLFANHDFNIDAERVLHYGPGMVVLDDFNLEPGEEAAAWVDQTRLLIYDRWNSLFRLLDFSTQEQVELEGPGRAWGSVRTIAVYKDGLYFLEQTSSGGTRQFAVYRLNLDGTNPQRIHDLANFGQGDEGRTLARQGRYWAIHLGDSQFGQPNDLVFLDLETDRISRWRDRFPDTAPQPDGVMSDARLFLASGYDGNTGILQDWVTDRRYAVDADQIALMRGLLAPNGATAATAQQPWGVGLYTTHLNLALLAEAQVIDNTSVRLFGTVADRRLQDWRLDYASVAAPDTWLASGLSGTFPIYDGTITHWIPPQPGAYLLRLTLRDHAGNQTTRLLAVTVDGTLPYHQLNAAPLLISPNSDGVQDAVDLNFEVRDPFEANLIVRNAEGIAVRQMTRYFGDPGPAAMTWDGRDGGGALLADGSYQLSFNDVTYDVIVDTTPPELALRFDAPIRAGNDQGTLDLISNTYLEVRDPLLREWILSRQAGDGEPWSELRRDTRPITTSAEEPERLLTRQVVFGATFRLEAVDAAGNQAVLTQNADITPQIWTMAGAGPFRETDDSPCYATAVGLGGLARMPYAALLPANRFPITLTGIELGDTCTRFSASPLVEAETTVFDGAWLEPGLTEANFPAETTYVRLVFTDALGGIHKTEAVRRLLLDFKVDYLGIGPRQTRGYPVDYMLSVHRDSGIHQLSANVLGTTDANGRFADPAVIESRNLIGPVCGKDSYKGVIFTAWWPDTHPPHAASGLANRAPFVLTDVVLNPGDSNSQTLAYLTAGPLCAAFSVAIYPDYSQCRPAEEATRRFVVEADGQIDVRPVIQLFADAGGNVPLAPPFQLNAVALDLSLLPDAGENPVYATVQDENGRNLKFRLTGRPGFLQFDVLGFHETEGRYLQPLGRLVRDESRLAVAFSDQIVCAATAAERLLYRTAPSQSRPIIRRSLVVDYGSTRFPTPTGTPTPSSAWPVVEAWAVPEGRDTPRINLNLSALSSGAVWPDVDLGPFLADEAQRWHISQTLIHPDGFCETQTALITFSDQQGGTTSAGSRILTDHSAGQVDFSPNADGVQDEARVVFELDTAQWVAAWIEHVESTQVVTTLLAGSAVSAGISFLNWDGRNSDGNLVSDGVYRLVLAAATDCGAEQRHSTLLYLDRNAPVALIHSPSGATDLPAQVFVSADDERGLAAARLLTHPDGEPAASTTLWSTDSGRFSNQPVTSLALGEAGDHVLLLQVTDKAGNSTETSVSVSVTPNPVIGALACDSAWLSANGDGRNDIVTARFNLKAAATVSLTLSGPQTQTLIDNLALPAGDHQTLIDGRDNGNALADGTYQLQLTALAGGVHTATLDLILDTTAPSVTVRVPEENAVIGAETLVVDTLVSDAAPGDLAQMRLEHEDPAGQRRLLSEGVAPTDGETARLEPTKDGRYRLFLNAVDQAGNRRNLTRTYVRDITAPSLHFEQPVAGTIVGDASVLQLAGVFEEVHPDRLILSLEPEQGDADLLADLGAAQLQGRDDFQFELSLDRLPDGWYRARAELRDQVALSSSTEVRFAIDRQPPLAALAALADGGLIRGGVVVRGTASDFSLVEYELAVRPEPAKNDDGYAILTIGDGNVEDGELYHWSQLPPDGRYRLRLRVSDALDRTAVAERVVLIDRSPPGAPADLSSALTQTGSFPNRRSDVHLQWSAVEASDLAGYLVLRNNQPLFQNPLNATRWTDEQAPDGDHLYQVVAVDLAGNQSDPSPSVNLTLDTQPPQPLLADPADGSLVGGLVTLRGSITDARLAAWTLTVAPAGQPENQQTLAQGTKTVAFGTLGQWAALAATPGAYAVRLSASDTFGNVGDHVITLTVETTAPAQPAAPQISVNNETVEIIWSASAESDLAHYRLYRNDRFIGTFTDLGTSETRPDGTYRYRLAAVDQAGNISPLSDESDPAVVNTRTPSVFWVNPSANARFEDALFLNVHSDQNDIASVTFAYQAAGDTIWTPIATDSAAPWSTTWSPALPDGEYDLRATAAEAGTGAVDASPPVVRVIKGDATPPAAPAWSTLAVDGATVSLAWLSVADAVGYRLYRNHVLLVDQAAVSYDDSDVPLGNWTYVVRAVDAAGNEGPPSETRTLTVFQPQPDYNAVLTDDATVQFSGSANPDFPHIDLYQDQTLIDSAVIDGTGRFTLTAPVTQPRLTTYRLAQHDNQDRHGLPVAVAAIQRSVPGQVTSWRAVGDGQTPENAVLNWSEPGDAAGYRIQFGTDLLQEITDVPSGLFTFTETPSGSSPTYLSDNNTATQWIATAAGNARFVIDLAQPTAVVGLRFVFPSGFEVPETVTVAAEQYGFEPLIWTIPLAGGTEIDTHALGLSAGEVVTQRLILHFQTSAQLALSELDIRHRPFLPAGTTQFTHTDPGIGLHSYRIAALDQTGLSELSEARLVGMGDYEAPEPPSALTATVDVDSVTLNWNPSPSSDVVDYRIRRDGRVLVTVTATSHRDGDLLAGDYQYTVTARDAAGNESVAAGPVLATIANGVGQPPELTGRADATSGHILLSWRYQGNPANVAGYRIYRRDGDAGVFEALNPTLISTTGYRDSGPLVAGTTYAYRVAVVDDAGRESFSNTITLAAPLLPPSLNAPAAFGQAITLFNNETTLMGLAPRGARVRIYQDGLFAGETAAHAVDQRRDLAGYTRAPAAMALSADGRYLAWSALTSSRLELFDQSTGTMRTISILRRAYDLAAAPEGRLFAYVDRNTSSSTGSLYTLDPDSGQRNAQWRAPNLTGPLAWWDGEHVLAVNGADLYRVNHSSRDAEHIYTGAGTILQLVVDNRRDGWLTLEEGAAATVQFIGADGAVTPMASGPIGTRFAWAAALGRLLLIDDAGAVHLLHFDENLQPRTPQPQALGTIDDVAAQVGISNDGTLLLTQAGDDTTRLWQITADALVQRDHSLQDEAAYRPQLFADGRLLIPYWAGGNIAAALLEPAGFFSHRADLNAGTNLFRAQTLLPDNGALSTQSAPVTVTYSTARLPELQVSDRDFTTVPGVIAAGDRALVQLNLHNRGGDAAAGFAVTWRLTAPNGEIETLTPAWLPSLAAETDATVGFTFDSQDRSPGLYRFEAMVDDNNTVAERDETNNAAATSILVTEGAGLALGFALDPTPLPALGRLNGTVTLANSGATVANLVIRLTVESAGGRVVADLGTFERAQLATAARTTFEVTWSSAAVLAGNYHLVATVTQNEAVVAADQATFTILADTRVDCALSGVPATLSGGLPLALSLAFSNASSNVAFRQAHWQLRLHDAQDNEINRWEGDLEALPPGAAATLDLNLESSAWGDGRRRFTLLFLNQGLPIATTTRSFLLDTAPVYDADIHFFTTPVRPVRNTDIQVRTALANTGNRDLDLTLQLDLIDSNDAVVANQTWTAFAAVGQSVEAEWRFPTADLLVGAYRLRLHNSAAPVPVLIDHEQALNLAGNTTPQLNLIGLPSGYETATPVTVVIEVADDQDPLPSATATLNDAPYLSGTTITDEGVYQLHAAVTDDDGLSARAQAAFVIDRSPPEIVFEGVAEGGSYPAPVTPVIIINDLTLVAADITLNDTTFSTGSAVTEPGTYRLAVVARDALGAVSEAIINFSVAPAEDPLLAFTGFSDGDAVNHAVTVGVTLFEAADLTGFSVNGHPVTPPVTVDSEGLFQFQASAANQSRDQTINAELTLDFTAPVVALSGFEDGAVYGESVFPSGTVDSLPAGDGQMFLNEQPFTPGSAVSDEGAYRVRLNASDAAGNSAATQAGFTIDLTPPRLVLFGVADGVDYTNTLLITWAVNDASATSDSATLNGRPVERPLSIVASGAYTLIVQASDAAGNTSQQRVDFTVDGVEPLILVSPIADGDVVAGPINLTVTVQNALRAPTFAARLNGQAFASGTRLDAEGDYELVVDALGDNGSPYQETYHFSIDNSPPLLHVGGVSPGAFYTAPVTPLLTQTETHPGTLTLTLNGAPFTSGTTLSVPGIYNLHAQAVDRAGNGSQVSLSFEIGSATDPRIDFDGVRDGTHYPGSVTPLVSFQGDNLRETRITLDDAPFNSGTEITAEGEYQLAAELTTADETRITRSAAFVIDRAAPVITISGVAEGTVYDRPVAPNIGVSDAYLLSQQLQLNGAAYSSGTAVTAAGAYTLTVAAEDRAGNRAQQTLSFTLAETPAFSITPNPLFFGNSDTAVDRTVTLFNGGQSTVHLDPANAVFTGNDAAAFRLIGFSEDTLTAGAQTTATLRFTPQRTGIHEAVMTLDTDHADIGSVALSLRANNLTVNAALAPDALSFGLVPIERSAEKSVAVTNYADILLQIDATLDDDTHFQLPTSLSPIDAGDTQALTVTYQPSGAGVDSTTLTVTAAEETWRVPVCGAGVWLTDTIALPGDSRPIPGRLLVGDSLQMTDGDRVFQYRTAGNTWQLLRRLGVGHHITHYLPDDSGAAFSAGPLTGVRYHGAGNSRDICAPPLQATCIDGADLIALTEDHRLLRFDHAGTTTAYTLPQDAPAFSAVVAAGDAWLLLAEGTLWRYQHERQQLAAWVSHTALDNIVDLMPGRQGGWLGRGEHRLVEISSAGTVTILHESTAALVTAAVWQDTVLYRLAGENRIMQWQPTEPTLFWLGSRKAVRAFALDEEGGRRYSIDEDGTLFEETDRERVTLAQNPAWSDITTLAFAAGELHGLTATGHHHRLLGGAGAALVGTTDLQAAHALTHQAGQWFALSGERLVRLESSGNATTIHTFTDAPQDLATDPDGATLWVLEQDLIRAFAGSGTPNGTTHTLPFAGDSLIALGEAQFWVARAGAVYASDADTTSLVAPADPARAGRLRGKPDSPAGLWLWSARDGLRHRLVPYTFDPSTWHRPGDPPEADVDGDGRIDVRDLIWHAGARRGVSL